MNSALDKGFKGSRLDGQLVLGRYRVIRPLAKGGMGVVHLGRLEGAAGFSKPVVIKQVLSHLEGEEVRAQFAREARILSELQHPGIVGVLDFGEESDSYVMVLEYVHGYHVGQWLRYTTSTKGEVSWEFATHVAVKVLEAIHYAHTRRDAEGQLRAIVHRDISPGNILIDLQGNVRLVDFGIARATGETETKDGVVKGKLSYIAPEIYGSGHPSVSSDLYAVGVVLYQLLTGKNPFTGAHMSDTIARVVGEVAPPVATKRQDTPEALDSALAKAMAKAPEDRYASAQEFAIALRKLLPRDETEISEEFQNLIRSQFTAALPDALKLPRLADLDAAWRESSHNPASERPLVVSSMPPSLSGEPTAMETNLPVPGSDEATRVGVSTELQGALALDRAVFQGDRSQALPEIQMPSQAPREGSAPTAGPVSRGGRKLALATILGAGLIAAAAAGAVLYFAQPKQSSDTKPRYLLVERESQARSAQPQVTEPESATAAPPAASTLKQPAAAAAAKAASPPVAQTSSAKPRAAASPLTALTQAFAKRQSTVQHCFKTHAGAMKGSPQISIRFEVAANGAVTSAQVRPAGIASTSLGQCLKGVALATRFPPQKEQVAFSIPIVARVVTH